MADPSINTGIIALIGSLALLTPLVKAISQWHITLRKMSKPDTAATATQSHLSQESKKPSLLRSLMDDLVIFSVLLINSVMVVFGLWLFSQLIVSTSPLTTSSAAMIAMAAVCIHIGFPRLPKQ
jgi:hypothetical protein